MHEALGGCLSIWFTLEKASELNGHRLPKSEHTTIVQLTTTMLLEIEAGLPSRPGRT